SGHSRRCPSPLTTASFPPTSARGTSFVKSHTSTSKGLSSRGRRRGATRLGPRPAARRVGGQDRGRAPNPPALPVDASVPAAVAPLPSSRAPPRRRPPQTACSRLRGLPRRPGVALPRPSLPPKSTRPPSPAPPVPTPPPVPPLTRLPAITLSLRVTEVPSGP